jgi:hypothetical protein
MLRVIYGEPTTEELDTMLDFEEAAEDDCMMDGEPAPPKKKRRPASRKAKTKISPATERTV